MYKLKLIEIGIPANLRGFEYLNTALERYKPSQGLIELYIDIAKKYGTRYPRVERSMRYAIKMAGFNMTIGAWIAKQKIIWGEEARESD